MYVRQGIHKWHSYKSINIAAKYIGQCITLLSYKSTGLRLVWHDIQLVLSF